MPLPVYIIRQVVPCQAILEQLRIFLLFTFCFYPLIVAKEIWHCGRRPGGDRGQAGGRKERRH